MNTTQQTTEAVQEYRITISAEYVSIWRPGNRSRSPLHFFELRTWASESTTPDEAVRAVLSSFFGKGAGFIRRNGDNLKIPQPGLDRIGLSLEKAAWINSAGEKSDSSVVVPEYKAFIYTSRIRPTSRAAMYGYNAIDKAA